MDLRRSEINNVKNNDVRQWIGLNDSFAIDTEIKQHSSYRYVHLTRVPKLSNHRNGAGLRKPGKRSKLGQIGLLINHVNMNIVQLKSINNDNISIKKLKRMNKQFQ